MTEPTRNDAIAELKRELAIRKGVYPKWVANGRMKQEDADRYVARMTKALHLLMEQAAPALAKEQRERDAELRDIAAEARWQERQGDEYGSY